MSGAAIHPHAAATHAVLGKVCTIIFCQHAAAVWPSVADPVNAVQDTAQAGDYEDMQVEDRDTSSRHLANAVMPSVSEHTIALRQVDLPAACKHQPAAESRELLCKVQN